MCSRDCIASLMIANSRNNYYNIYSYVTYRDKFLSESSEPDDTSDNHYDDNDNDEDAGNSSHHSSYDGCVPVSVCGE